MKSLKGNLVLVAAGAVALSACSSGVDQAREEMTQACVSSANGQLTEEECGCMTDRTFAELNSEEIDFVEQVYQLDPGISDADAAAELGMDPAEFRRLSSSFARKASNSAVGAAMECFSS